MTAPTTDEPTGTAVATTKTAAERAAEREAMLSPAAREQLYRVKETRALTVAITNESWGQGISPAMRSALAEYMRRHRLDVTEVDILGGKIYRNGNYYKRRVAEMRTRGLIESTEGRHIGPDAQLEAAAKSDDPEIAAWARTENFARLKERVRWAVPPDATHAYVVSIKLRTDEKVIEGADWITPDRKNSYNKTADPIGAAEPEKTVITRAWRRAGMLAAAEIPALKGEEEAIDADAEVVESNIEHIKREEDDRELSMRRPQAAIAAPTEPYGETMTAVSQPREVETVDASKHRADPVAIERGLAIKDPYGETASAPSGTAAAADDEKWTPFDDAPAAPVARPRSKAALFPLPFGSADKKGMPIGDLSAEDLELARAYATKNGKHQAFLDASDELLEERAFDADDKPGTDAAAD